MAAATKNATPVEVAIAHRDGQRRLREGGATKVAGLAKAVEKRETRVADADQAEQRARRARDEHPDDARASKAHKDATEALEYERKELARDRAALDAGKSELAGFEAKHVEAQLAVDRASVAAEIASPARAEAHRARGRRVFEIAEAAREVMVEHREAIAAERAIEQRAAGLGVPVTATSGLQAARGFVEVLLERGLDVASFAQPLQIRELFDVRPDGPSLARVLVDAVAIVVAAIGSAPSVNGRKVLLDTMEQWGAHRSFTDALRAQQADADAEQHRHEQPAQVLDERRRLAAFPVAQPGVRGLGPRLIGKL